MTRREISQLIEKEINGDWSFSNSHNCDLKKCLISPKRSEMRFGAEIKKIWIVLEENIETLEGFKIFFDEESKQFGLAMHSDTSPFSYACNSHSTFLAAFKSM